MQSRRGRKFFIFPLIIFLHSISASAHRRCKDVLQYGYGFSYSIEFIIITCASIANCDSSESVIYFVCKLSMKSPAEIVINDGSSKMNANKIIPFVFFFYFIQSRNKLLAYFFESKINL